MIISYRIAWATKCVILERTFKEEIYEEGASSFTTFFSTTNALAHYGMWQIFSELPYPEL